MRQIVTLACSQCKRRNYTTTKRKKPGVAKIELKKFCKFCRVHTLHKEVR